MWQWTGRDGIVGHWWWVLHSFPRFHSSHSCYKVFLVSFPTFKICKRLKRPPDMALRAVTLITLASQNSPPTHSLYHISKWWILGLSSTLKSNTILLFVNHKSWELLIYIALMNSTINLSRLQPQTWHLHRWERVVTLKYWMRCNYRRMSMTEWRK